VSEHCGKPPGTGQARTGAAAPRDPGGVPAQARACLCGRMICTDAALLVPGMGWLSMQTARTTALVFRTLPGK